LFEATRVETLRSHVEILHFELLNTLSKLIVDFINARRLLTGGRLCHIMRGLVARVWLLSLHLRWLIRAGIVTKLPMLCIAHRDLCLRLLRKHVL